MVLDPVAVGGTQLRRDAAKRLLKEVHFTAIRGNASEIRYLAGQQTTGAGVDVSDLDAITEENLPEAQEMIKNLAKSLGTVIVFRRFASFPPTIIESVNAMAPMLHTSACTQDNASATSSI